jgi:hypothetical protein
MTLLAMVEYKTSKEMPPPLLEALFPVMTLLMMFGEAKKQ